MSRLHARVAVRLADRRSSAWRQTMLIVGVSASLGVFAPDSLLPTVIAQVERVGTWSTEGSFDTSGFSYTPESGCNRLAVVIIASEGNTNPVANVNTVTLGGRTLTAIQNSDGSVAGAAGDYHNILWMGYINESDISSMSGTSLLVTWDQAPNTPFGQTKVAAATYAHVNQTTPIADSAANTSTSGTTIQAGSVSVGASDLLIYSTIVGNPYNHSAPAGYTEAFEVDGGIFNFSFAAVERDATTSSSENPTATWSSSDRLVMINAVLNYDAEDAIDLEEHPSSQESDAFSESAAETDAELFAFQLTPFNGTQTVTSLVFSLSNVTAVTDGDWAGIEIVVDSNGDGAIGGGETTTVGGSGTVSTSGGTITFSTSFTVTATTQYILRADFSSLSDGDRITVGLTDSNITSSVCVAGSATSASHAELDCSYTESNETWTASSADSWETVTLSGSPYNVPANAILEVGIRNDAIENERSGGVRAVGSSLQRRLQLQEAEAGGDDILVMHVTANASSQIEYYSDDTGDVDFILLGYWESDCGTYAEAFDSFTAGSSGSWVDVNLSTYSVASCSVAEIVVTNDNASSARQAGVRRDGSSRSRIVDLQNAEAGGVDTGTFFVQADDSANATIEVYAENTSDVDFYHVGRWSTRPGAYIEIFQDAGSPSSDASWQDLDLSSLGVAAYDVVEFVLANEITWSENNMGVRSNGSSRTRVFDLQEAEDGGDSLGRMHVVADGSATIEYYQEDISDSHTFNVVGSWVIGGNQQLLEDHITGQETDAFTQSGSETDAELFAFELNPLCDTTTITQIVFRLTSISGLTDGDWGGIELLVDADDSGDISGGETTAVGGTGVVNTAGGTITFSTSFSLTAETSYILRADFASLSNGDQVTIGLDKADVTTTASVTGSTGSATHIERCSYESLAETWTPSASGSWTTQDLSGSPYNVPANAVVEVAIRNDSTGNERFGGIRAVGASVDRRIELQEAEAGGYDILVLHTQASASSTIEYYAESTSDIDFVLLGYWECGTYVDTFDTFTAGANTSWQDRDLCTYGVSPQYVAEIAFTNDDTGNEREAGVRTNGSSLSRIVDLQEAEGGGVDAGSMIVRADNTPSATIELYAEDNSDIDFYLVGYWSVAPLNYTELYADVGSPSSDGSWEDIDLTSFSVPDNAVVEIAFQHEVTDTENMMGLRPNGSSADRRLDLQESEGGGDSVARAHTLSDGSAIVELYHEDVSDTHTFRLMGYWDSCDSAVEYIVTDLGANTAANSAGGFDINASNQIAGFEQAAGGATDGWLSDCGTLTDVGNLSGATNAECLAINASGVLAGRADNSSSNSRAFTWTSGGGMIDLGITESRTESEAFAINANSEVCGSVFNIDSGPDERLAMIYLPNPAYNLTAGMTSLGTLGGEESVATDINDSGQVVGGAQTVGGVFRPFRWENGTMTDLGTLGADEENITHRAEGVNASGNTVGRSFTAGGEAHAFYYDGSMTDLGVLTGGDSSWAFDINDSNVVVGTSNVTGGNFRAFVYDSTNNMRNLNDLIDSGSGWTLTRATAINNNGFITGFGTNGSADLRGFLLTPACSAGGGGAAFFYHETVQRVGRNGQAGYEFVSPRGELL
ncbi:MAG: hypothetical protein ACPGXK_13015, partial [Phycisphaerae bacterium]